MNMKKLMDADGSNSFSVFWFRKISSAFRVRNEFCARDAKNSRKVSSSTTDRRWLLSRAEEG